MPDIVVQPQDLLKAADSTLSPFRSAAEQDRTAKAAESESQARSRDAAKQESLRQKTSSDAAQARYSQAVDQRNQAAAVRDQEKSKRDQAQAASQNAASLSAAAAAKKASADQQLAQEQTRNGQEKAKRDQAEQDCLAAKAQADAAASKKAQADQQLAQEQARNAQEKARRDATAQQAQDAQNRLGDANNQKANADRDKQAADLSLIRANDTLGIADRFHGAVDICRQFAWQWNDSGSGAQMDGSFFRTTPQAGYVSLGDHAIAGYGNPGAVMVIKSDGPIPWAYPVRYDLVWADWGSGAHADGSFWRPIPPEGYVALGHVAQAGYGSPSLQAMVCVHSSFVEYTGNSQTLIWADWRSGADMDGSFWLQDQIGVMIAQSGYAAPGTVPNLSLSAIQAAISGAPATSAMTIMARSRILAASFDVGNAAVSADPSLAGSSVLQTAAQRIAARKTGFD